MTEQLTTDGLRLALETLKGKWGTQGAQFTGQPDHQGGAVTQAFTFDDQVYEVTILADTSLQIVEVTGAVHRTVRIPRGLAFPKGFKRTAEYDVARRSTRRA